LDINDLAKLDQVVLSPLLAIEDKGNAAIGSFATPRKFLCSDAHLYWVKWQSQHGLVTELIAGRLASLLGAGPKAEIINIPPGIFNLSGNDINFEGLVVGSQDIPNTENARYISQHLSANQIPLDIPSLCRVIGFQTWLGVSDQQALIELTNGRVFSIDHGDVFSDAQMRRDFNVVLIPQLQINLVKIPLYIYNVIGDIENIADNVILNIVSKVPDEPRWDSSRPRRFGIFDWLRNRRDNIRREMDKWLQQP
jgi:hypothetical protein